MHSTPDPARPDRTGPARIRTDRRWLRDARLVERPGNTDRRARTSDRLRFRRLGRCLGLGCTDGEHMESAIWSVHDYAATGADLWERYGTTGIAASLRSKGATRRQLVLGDPVWRGQPVRSPNAVA